MTYQQFVMTYQLSDIPTAISRRVSAISDDPSAICGDTSAISDDPSAYSDDTQRPPVHHEAAGHQLLVMTRPLSSHRPPAHLQSVM